MSDSKRPMQPSPSGAANGRLGITGNPCTALTCAAGKTCMILESYPEQLVCGN